jgi:hypothetical protein
MRAARMVAAARASHSTGNQRSGRRCIIPSSNFRAARPGTFAAAYVIGIPTDGLFGARVPTGSGCAGWETVHNLASVILNEVRRHG